MRRKAFFFYILLKLHSMNPFMCKTFMFFFYSFIKFSLAYNKNIYVGLKTDSDKKKLCALRRLKGVYSAARFLIRK